MNPVAITTFYRFQPLSPEQVEAGKTHLEKLAEAHAIRGLVLMGREGLNATISGAPPDLESLKSWAREFLSPDVRFKDSESDRHPFQVFKVKVKNEIVTLGRPDLVPQADVDGHISPAEWQRMMTDGEAVVLDTRNDYEIELGKFKGAVDFALKEFNEFPEKLRSSGLSKVKPVLMYCTGGIRCEKAILEARAQGFEKVYQLDGGILNYLKEFPERDFTGECFVFDYRVAVDQKLNSTQVYKLCPHCGQPAKTKIECVKCGRPEYVCPSCLSENNHTCSKNCAHHLKIGSASSKPHVQEIEKRKARE